VVSLKLSATIGLKGTILAQAQVEFENVSKVNKQLVAVLPLEGKDLTPDQRTAFSDAFQSSIAQSGEYQLASSAEVSKMSPDEIQKVQNCTRDECATTIGAQLGVDRVISSTVAKLGEGKYQVSAKVLSVKDGTIVKTATADHEGDLANLKSTLATLSTRLTNRQVADLGIDAMLAAQAQARSEELAKIAAEQDKIKKAQLENEASWREIARQAELNRAKWVVIDDSLSLEKAIAEADALRAEFAATEKEFEAQWKKSQANLALASKVEKDPFETPEEFKKRATEAGFEESKRLVQQEQTYLSQKIEVLEPFEKRLAEFQAKRFTLPEVKLTASLGSPDAVASNFPITIFQGKKSWSGTWPYQDREQAKALYATKTLITVQAKAALSNGAKDKTGTKLTKAEALHPGVGAKQTVNLETPVPFPELAVVEGLRVKLRESEGKQAKLEAERIAALERLERLERFVPIKGGCFLMGDSFKEGEDDERLHEVCVSDFYLGKYEVTQEEWEKVMGNNPSDFERANNPVENMSWNDIQDFLGKLNAQSDGKYRLPTEAEWEYACREGGKKVKFGNGKDILDPREANFNGSANKESYSVQGKNRQRTTPVGSFAPNALGLYDMSGNVWEWVQDWYGDYPSKKQTNPTGPSGGSNRVYRGGSWLFYPRTLRCAYRDSRYPSGSHNLLGFRLLRTAP